MPKDDRLNDILAKLATLAQASQLQEVNSSITDLVVAFNFSMEFFNQQLQEFHEKQNLLMQEVACLTAHHTNANGVSDHSGAKVAQLKTHFEKLASPPKVLHAAEGGLGGHTVVPGTQRILGAVDVAVASGDLAAIPSGGLGGHTVVPG